jgi:hypothetical protein
MKLTPRTLLFVFGIPAGYLPLLAAVELGPAEVGVTLFLVAAFGWREAIRAERIVDHLKRQRRVWCVAKVSFVYACCLLIGFPLAAIAKNGWGPTPFQRWLFGEPRSELLSFDYALTVVIVRWLEVSLCGFATWFASMAVASKQRAAFWLLLCATPVVFANLWLLLSAVGPAALKESWLATARIACRRRRDRGHRSLAPATPKTACPAGNNATV